MVWSPDRASISVWCRPQRLTPRSEIKSAHASPHRTWSPSPAGPSHLLPRTDRFLLLTTGGLISVRRAAWCQRSFQHFPAKVLRVNPVRRSVGADGQTREQGPASEIGIGDPTQEASSSRSTVWSE